MKKAIIFDFGGVLIDWSPFNLYRKLLPSDEAIREFLQEIDFHNFNTRLDAGFPFSKMKIELLEKYPGRRDLVSAFFERWMECTGDAIQPTVDIMLELKQSGYQVYGLSNWSNETFPLLRHRYGFLSQLDDYLISGVAGVAKPDKKIYQLLLDRIGRSAQECVFIDDSQVNIDAAIQLGFTGILHTSPTRLRVALLELGIL